MVVYTHCLFLNIGCDDCNWSVFGILYCSWPMACNMHMSSGVCGTLLNMCGSVLSVVCIFMLLGDLTSDRVTELCGWSLQ